MDKYKIYPRIKTKEETNYRKAELKCCSTCRHSRYSKDIGDGSFSFVCSKQRMNHNDVNKSYVCDLYK